VGGAQPTDDNTPRLDLTIWDLSQLPALVKLSENNLAMSDDFGGSLTAVWPKPNVLVWSGGSQFFGWFGGPVALGAPMAAEAVAWWPGFWGGNSGGRLIAFDVADAANPSLKSVVAIATNSWNFSKPIIAEGLVYLSHQTTETVTLDVPPPADPTDPTIDPSKTNATTIGWGGGTNPPPVIFITRSYLDVIDYADAANPVVRKPVNIPGALQGASHQGGVVYTLGMHFNAQGGTDGTEWLDASAYDGVSAFLIDSHSLTNWPHPIAFTGPDIFIGGVNSLERWQLTNEGLFAKLSTTDSKEPVYSLRLFGDLAVLTTSARILLYNATDRAALKLIGQSDVNCNAGADLQNADGAVARGLWLPENDYGVQIIPVQ
jgi:hypothetical protein